MTSEAAEHVARRLLANAFDDSYERKILTQHASQLHWREYMDAIKETKGEKKRALKQITEQRIRAAANRERTGK